MEKIIIIGAGPAGLTTAYEILRKTNKYEVVILEQTDRIGGIACTINHNENYMDLGGHRFYSKCDDVTKWWLDIPNVKILKRNRKSEIYFDGKFFDYPVKANFKNLSALGIRELILIFSDYIKAQLHKRNEISLEDFYINRFGKRLYQLFFKNYTEKVWGVAPDRISPDWGSQRVKGLSIFEVIKDSIKSVFSIKNNSNTQTSLIEEFYYPEHGPGELWNAVATEIIKMGGIIKNNCQVSDINSETKKISEIVYSLDKRDFSERADILISSMPIKNLIAGMNDVPQNIRKLSNDLVYRDFITVGVLVKSLNIKSDDCWIYMQDKNVSVGRIQIFNNWSESLVKDPKNTIWLGLEFFCSKGDCLWNKSDDEMKSLAVEELIKTKIITDKEVVLDFHVEKLEKAYPCYFGAYEKFFEIKGFLNEFDNLYCIGRNGQHRYNNMDHSMITAFECVDAIINNTNNKDKIWNVNTEKEYN